MFDPQSLINRLGKMDGMVDKTAVQPKKQADAFRTWLSARKHFGAGAAMGGGATDHAHRRTSAPAVVMFPSPKSGKPGQGNTRPETERAREYLGQAVASQNKIEQLQEECTVYIIHPFSAMHSCTHTHTHIYRDYYCGCMHRLSKPVS